jgi:hypothetical protein
MRVFYEGDSDGGGLIGGVSTEVRALGEILA